MEEEGKKIDQFSQPFPPVSGKLFVNDHGAVGKAPEVQEFNNKTKKISDLEKVIKSTEYPRFISHGHVKSKYQRPIWNTASQEASDPKSHSISSSQDRKG